MKGNLNMQHILVSHSAAQALLQSTDASTRLRGELGLLPPPPTLRGPSLGRTSSFPPAPSGHSGMASYLAHPAAGCTSVGWAALEEEAREVPGARDRRRIKGSSVSSPLFLPLSYGLRAPLKSRGSSSHVLLSDNGRSQEGKRTPYSPETSAAALVLAFTTYVLRVHRLCLAGRHAGCGEKRTL